jgi:hypothetical protein
MLFGIFMFATTNIIAKRMNAYNHFFKNYEGKIIFSSQFFSENDLYMSFDDNMNEFLKELWIIYQLILGNYEDKEGYDTAL